MNMPDRKLVPGILPMTLALSLAEEATSSRPAK